MNSLESFNVLMVNGHIIYFISSVPVLLLLSKVLFFVLVPLSSILEFLGEFCLLFLHSVPDFHHH